MVAVRSKPLIKDAWMSQGIIPDYDGIAAQAQREAVICIHCGKPVHPSNLKKHTELYHQQVRVSMGSGTTLVYHEHKDSPWITQAVELVSGEIKYIRRQLHPTTVEYNGGVTPPRREVPAFCSYLWQGKKHKTEGESSAS